MFRFSNIIVFELTRDCNIHCKYCYVTDKENYKGEVIDFEVYKRIIDRISEQRYLHGLRNTNFTLSIHGGECTLIGKELFKKCLEYATNTFLSYGLDYSIGVQTNGTLLDEEWLDIFYSYNVSLGVSLDSIYEKEDTRFNKNTKRKIIETLKLASKKNLATGILSVLNRKNFNLLYKDDKYIKENIGEVRRKINFVEITDKKINAKEYELTGKEIFKKFHLKELKRFIRSHRIPEYHNTLLLDDTLIDLLTIHSSGFKTGCSGRLCGAGITMLAVRPDGSMGYCDRYSKNFKENQIQNALDYDFLALHQLSKVISFNKVKSDILKETECDTCRARFICEGGCLAFYYSKFGFYGIDKDLICPQYKNYYDFVEKNLVKIIKIFKEEHRSLIVDELRIYELNTYYIDLLRRNNIEVVSKYGYRGRDYKLIRLEFK